MKHQKTLRTGLTVGFSLLTLIGLSAYTIGASASAIVQKPGPATAENAVTLARLAPCPDSPNCVSTLSNQSDDIHFIAPIPFSGAASDAKAQILAIINAMPRTKIIADEGNYVHAEFRSLVFRFVDDIEFVVDEATQMIHFRSASRLGYGDLGVNRKRMEEIRSQFTRATA